MQEGNSPRFGRGGAERRRTAGMALTARPSSLGAETECFFFFEKLETECYAAV